MNISLIPPPTDDPFASAMRADLIRQTNDERDALSARTVRLEEQLKIDPQDTSTRLELANCMEIAGDQANALRICLEGVHHTSESPANWWSAIQRLNQAGRSDEAQDYAARARKAFPTQVQFALAHRLMLPVLYQTEAELASRRDQFTSGLDLCIAEVPLHSAADVRNAIAGFGHWTNFLLAYQAQNDVVLNSVYGRWLCSVLSREYPAGAAAPRKAKRRIGFVSAHLFDHSVGRCMIGWLEQLDKSRFEVFSYFAASESDGLTARFRACSRQFFQSCNLVELIAALVSDRVDILVYLDVGMSPITTQLAGLRLAPIQCASWGHSVTTGLPTIDYFLSSASMEPADADHHYSETLVRLPGLGFSYAHPRLPRPLFNFSRTQFQINDNAIVYLCCQSSFKYLPQHDQLLARIARQVPRSQFVFVLASPLLAASFRLRLVTAFEQEGLSADSHCVLLSNLGALEYSQLYLFADIYLDSLGWSGCNTTLEAIARHVPVVTCPGKFQRGRQSSALLRAIGVAETTAIDEDDFVAIAVRLAQDEAFRSKIVQRMSDAEAVGGGVTDCGYIAALEDFLDRAEPLSGEGARKASTHGPRRGPI